MVCRGIQTLFFFCISVFDFWICWIHGDLWFSLSLLLIFYGYFRGPKNPSDDHEMGFQVVTIFWKFQKSSFFFSCHGFRFVCICFFFILGLWTLGFMVVRCNSGRCGAVETEKCNTRYTVCYSGCLGGVWKIWLHSAVTCCKCSPAFDCHSFPLG